MNPDGPSACGGLGLHESEPLGNSALEIRMTLKEESQGPHQDGAEEPVDEER